MTPDPIRPMQEPEATTVAIVGAGLSGLIAVGEIGAVTREKDGRDARSRT